MASYYVWSGATGSANGTSWANAYITLTLAFGGKAAGDVFYVAHDHAESTAGPITLSAANNTANPAKVICVNRGGSVPPVSADRRATAQVSTTGASNITINNSTHYDGIIFSSGTGTSTGSNINLGTSNNVWLRFDNCSLRMGINASSPLGGISVGTAASGAIHLLLYNTTVSFAHASNAIFNWGWLKWCNTPSAILGTAPTILFMPNAAEGGSLECIGVDLSAAGSGKTIVDGSTNAQGASFKFIDCKLDAGVTKAIVPLAFGSPEIDFIRCGATGVSYAIYRTRVSGLLTEETTIVRSGGGASDGTTPISWKVVTTANCIYSMPFECPPIAIWNDTVGASVTATVEGIWDGGAVPNDDDVWLDVEYLGDASSPQGSFANDGKANLLATAAAQASSTETWGGSTTKFKLGAIFTPQQKGWVYARVKCAKPSSTFYIDPMVALS